MDGVQFHHQECRKEEAGELYPPLSANESAGQPHDNAIGHRQGQSQLALGNFVLQKLLHFFLQIGAYIATEIYVGKLYFLRLFERLLQGFGLVLAVR